LTKSKKTSNFNTVMNTATSTLNLPVFTQPASPARVASLIAELVISKGTCFAGFDYDGKRRNLTIGKGLLRHTKGGNRPWGKSFANTALVEHNGKLYLQGVENNLGDGQGRAIRTFELSKVSGLVVG
jgi:hypothetical protein